MSEFRADCTLVYVDLAEVPVKLSMSLFGNSSGFSKEVQPMDIVVLMLTIVAVITKGDVIRTVFCRKQCTDYLKIPENSMPLCAPEYLQLKECGTVVSCDWAEADRDKVRPTANSSDFLCCYRVIVKEKGECVEPPLAETESVQAQLTKAGYIAKLIISDPKHQKISESDEMDCPPTVVTHPLIDMRHFGNSVRSGCQSVDELSCVHVAMISCDWPEVDRDKVRPIANLSDFLRCYLAVVSFADHCGFSFFSWILCIIFFAIIILQAGYIVMLRIFGPKYRKISQSDEKNCRQALTMHPLVVMRHFDNTVSNGHLWVDELSTVHVPSAITRLE
uniref:Uncharacterized protein n=1 Tax=Angiostrongylus cantonensis TaxID=6313 RepID=A0A158P916_ANGCA